MPSRRSDRAAIAKANHARVKYTREANARAARAREAGLEDLRTIGFNGRCWCGEEHGHAWPGKEDGAPHPRKTKEE